MPIFSVESFIESKALSRVEGLNVYLHNTKVNSHFLKQCFRTTRFNRLCNSFFNRGHPEISPNFKGFKQVNVLTVIFLFVAGSLFFYIRLKIDSCQYEAEIPETFFFYLSRNVRQPRIEQNVT